MVNIYNALYILKLSPHLANSSDKYYIKLGSCCWHLSMAKYEFRIILWKIRNIL